MERVGKGRHVRREEWKRETKEKGDKGDKGGMEDGYRKMEKRKRGNGRRRWGRKG